MLQIDVTKYKWSATWLSGNRAAIDGERTRHGPASNLPWHFLLLGGLGKQLKMLVISLINKTKMKNFKRKAISWYLRKQIEVIVRQLLNV